jgi:hypothetical protein
MVSQCELGYYFCEVIEMGRMYFAKMNINEQIYELYEGKKSLNELQKKIFSGISTKINIFDEKGGRIKFFDLDIASQGFKVTGNLGYIKKGVHSSYDPEKDTAIDTTDNNKIDYISFFFDVENELLAYMTIPVLGRKQVLTFFQRLIKKGSNVGVEFLQESNISDIKKEIRRFQHISKLEVRLVPPNGDKDDFAELSSLTVDRIQESNATKIEQKFQTQRKEGIKRDSELVKNYITAAGLGYSEIKFSGKDTSGQSLEISSDTTTPYTKNVPSDQVKNHTKIADIARAGIASIMEYRTKEKLKLDQRKNKK